MGYQSIQFSPDGEDYILDYHELTVDCVWSRVDDQGSKWFFYPFPFVITDTPGDVEHKHIVSACEGLRHLEGHTIPYVRAFFTESRDYIRGLLS